MYAEAGSILFENILLNSNSSIFDLILIKSSMISCKGESSLSSFAICSNKLQSESLFLTSLNDSNVLSIEVFSLLSFWDKSKSDHVSS